MNYILREIYLDIIYRSFQLILSKTFLALTGLLLPASCNMNSTEETERTNERLSKIEQPMEQVSDKFEMREKMGLYTFAWDEGKPEEFRKLYTDEITFKVLTPIKNDFLYGVDGLEENIQQRAALQQGMEKSAIRHNLSEVVFLELSSSAAKTKTVYSFLFFLDVYQAELPLVISGTLNDRWVKTEDKGWLIQDRIIIYDNLPPAIAQMFQ